MKSKKIIYIKKVKKQANKSLISIEGKKGYKILELLLDKLLLLE